MFSFRRKNKSSRSSEPANAPAPTSPPVTVRTPSAGAPGKSQAAQTVAPTSAAAGWSLLIPFIPTVAQYGPQVSAGPHYHRGATCDGCGRGYSFAFIFGPRYQCNTCTEPSFDLCSICYNKDRAGELKIDKPNPKSTHERSHGFKVVKPADTAQLSVEAALAQALLIHQVEPIKQIAALLPPDVDINTSKSLNTVIPIINAFAVLYKTKEQIQLVRYMVDNYKLDLLRPNAENETAIHLACRFENVALLEMMLDTGIVKDKGLFNTVSKKTGYTPLLEAVGNDATEVVKFLIGKGGVDPNAKVAVKHQGKMNEITPFEAAIAQSRNSDNGPELAELIFALGGRLPPGKEPETGTFTVSNKGVYVMDPYHRPPSLEARLKKYNLSPGDPRAEALAKSGIIAKTEVGIEFRNALPGQWHFRKEYISDVNIGTRVRSLCGWHSSASVIPLQEPGQDEIETKLGVSVDCGRVSIVSCAEFDQFLATPEEKQLREQLDVIKHFAPSRRLARLELYDGEPDEHMIKNAYGVWSSSGIGDGIGYPVYAALADGTLVNDPDAPVASIRAIFLDDFAMPTERKGNCSIM
ncbi:hypothetical protein BJ742DRAFT_830498 [Cladochytrium replicatum]|nr:hypothetical protein BJ742DRAFT_830498 [Cladochytrium replicatum]